ncbi:uncharacterized protein A1O5_04347 [Cladophialophora psammophila CBS 110553]|uniref:Aminoglycoside phosphotransferase domain-containing protein n=1 Tax=Cladophialophora psammophila CBS 110553 TaxID=1182543 RepID=W9X4M0_9EURO|nr:uncharacterized protein A1O5_04347 [Cladophialophora psammophila CBS 110553]EXJ71846.1 hypothetical protein A1O5_04347 [Cladophialophora psammophila CBS 110553]
MKINSSEQNIANVLARFESALEPELVTAGAKAAASEIKAVLLDLYRRQGPQKDLLQKLIESGNELKKDIEQFLRSEAPQTNGLGHAATNLNCFDDLAQHYDKLSTQLFLLLEELRTTPQESAEVAKLMRRGAEWEVAYFEGIQKIPVEMPSHVDLLDPPAPELSHEYLQRFFDGKIPGLQVKKFERLSGGHGKQTYLCTILRPDGTTEDRIIRKEDPCPVIVHPQFGLEREYALLKALNKIDFPAPKVYEFGKQIPGPDGVDGAFATMQLLPGAIPSNFLASGGSKFSEDLLLHMAEVLAKLHSVPLEIFSDYFEAWEDPNIAKQTTRDRYQNCLEQWIEYSQEFEHLPSAYLVWILDWLLKHIPEDSRAPVLVHGDYNVHNVLAENNRMTGLLDWETADFGAPEQDLAYIQPLVSKSMEWSKFLQHYHACGGKEVDESRFPFYLAYGVLRVVLAFNRATLNLQKRWSPDIRFNMVELGYQAVFMRMGLSYTETAPS